MKIFACPNCSATIYFENTRCTQCNVALGFDIETLKFLAFEDNNSANGSIAAKPYRRCKNFEYNVCNWLIEGKSEFCKCCVLNRTIPNIQDLENYEKWRKLEFAKHRLIYQLIRLGLPVFPKSTRNPNELAFDFLTKDNPDGALTGHANGVITILLLEADSVQREQLRKELSEPYRTLIGHFRHEIGHYYWPILIGDNQLKDFRELFGDETNDYGKSLQRYYQEGSPKDWSKMFISKYASSHPWEDWAETWAHYLHLMDTLETAHYLKLALPFGDDSLHPEICPNPYLIEDFDTIFEWGIALTCAGNSLNRSMGLPDIYPFIIPRPVFKKLRFIHQVLLENRSEYNR